VIFDGPYSRQVCLAEVGLEGQTRLEASQASVADTKVGSVEADYLRRAGARVTSGAPLLGGFEHAAFFEHGPSREVAEGAWRALCHIHRVLGIAPAEPSKEAP